MINTNNLESLIGSNVIDSDGDKIGTIGQVYIDTDTARRVGVRPHRAVRDVGDFRPDRPGRQTGEDIRVPYTRNS